jgi:hypothetical protein
MTPRFLLHCTLLLTLSVVGFADTPPQAQPKTSNPKAAMSKETRIGVIRALNAELVLKKTAL